MGRDIATSEEAPPPQVGRVRITDDTPPESDPSATSRELPAKIILGVMAVIIMVAALAVIIQLAISVAGP